MLDEAVREFGASTSSARATARDVLRRTRPAQAGRWHDATLFQQMVSRRAVSAAVYHNLAYALERLGRFDESTDVLAQAISRGQHDSRTLLSSGVSRAGAATSSRPTFCWRKRRRCGTGAEACCVYHYAALTAALANDIDRAIGILTDDVAAPASAVLLNNLGVALERRGRMPDAAMAFERALEDATPPHVQESG
jgi:tetratricopeptide (TPR) repeat protein